MVPPQPLTPSAAYGPPLEKNPVGGPGRSQTTVIVNNAKCTHKRYRGDVVVWGADPPCARGDSVIWWGGRDFIPCIRIRRGGFLKGEIFHVTPAGSQQEPYFIRSRLFLRSTRSSDEFTAAKSFHFDRTRPVHQNNKAVVYCRPRPPPYYQLGS